MKIAVKILTALAIAGLIAGITLILLKKIEIADIVWSVTAVISFGAYRVERYRVNI